VCEMPSKKVTAAVPVTSVNVQQYMAGRFRRICGGVLLIGGTEMGKTTLTKTILGTVRDEFYDGIIFSSTNSRNHEFDGMLPPNKIYDAEKIDEGVLRIVHAFHEAAKAHKASIPEFAQLEEIRHTLSDNEYERRFDKIAHGHRFFILFEDLTSTKTMFNHQIIMQIFNAGRHDLITTFISLHDPRGIANTMRQNAKWVLTLPIEGDPERLRKEFFECIPHDEFRTFYRTFTHDHTVIVDDRKLAKKRPKPDGKPLFFVWKGPHPVPHCKIGGKHLWATCQVMYDPNTAKRAQENSKSIFLAQQELERQAMAAELPGSNINPYTLENMTKNANSVGGKTQSKKPTKQQNNNNAKSSGSTSNKSSSNGESKKGVSVNNNKQQHHHNNGGGGGIHTSSAKKPKINHDTDNDDNDNNSTNPNPIQTFAFSNPKEKQTTGTMFRQQQQQQPSYYPKQYDENMNSNVYNVGSSPPQGNTHASHSTMPQQQQQSNVLISNTTKRLPRQLIVSEAMGVQLQMEPGEYPDYMVVRAYHNLRNKGLAHFNQPSITFGQAEYEFFQANPNL